MKKIKIVFLVLLVYFTLAVPVFAYDEPIIQSSNESLVEPRTEEFCWYYRDNNGVLERRCWSITYGKWVTDWIPCE